VDPVTRDMTIKALTEHLRFCQVQFASLDNDAERRSEMEEASNAIQLLLDFLDREQKKERL
jgi:hypothetical protein